MEGAFRFQDQGRFVDEIQEETLSPKNLSIILLRAN